MKVVVLGAGASHHVGYPLTKDLCPKLLDWAERNEPANQLYWPDRDGLSGFASLDDIEELVSQVEKAQKPGPILEGLRNTFCAYFDSIRANDAPLYRQLAEDVVKAGDVVITFNYDVSLDRELRRAGIWEVRDGYGFEIHTIDPPRSGVKLLKLHGSTNWIDSLFNGLRGGQTMVGGGDSHGVRPVLLPQEFEFLEYSGIKDLQFNGGGVSRAGSMVLPSTNKRFHIRTSGSPREREDFWSHLWNQAADALRTAHEIVVIGYSLPLADERARSLLLDAENSGTPVTVCCGGDNERLRCEFRQAGFKDVRTDLECFDNWLDAVSGRSAGLAVGTAAC